MYLMRVPSWDSTDDSSIDKVKSSFERWKHFCQFQGMIDAFPCHIHLPVYVCDPHSRAAKKETRPGVCQVPKGRGEQRKMEETGYEVVCGASMTLAVNGQAKEEY